jgi:hypothetical protein
MLRRRLEKLEAALPLSSDKLLERLKRQALSSLSSHDRELVGEKLRATGCRRRAWSAEHLAAEMRYSDAFGILLQEITDDELAGLAAEMEAETNP